ncbi:hypothetical protein H5410_023397 [Solanum commersonii]|uniref:Uncharacterized protein n=1 Tax=Solanum commersonii TaxID=4109 RepID=A0A9J5ZJJ2_SOLCO|nr:hypothetical protein H5410_023397 [Solanum commersonii]
MRDSSNFENFMTNDNFGRRFSEFSSEANTVIFGLLKKTNKQEKQLNCRWMLKLILGISLICNMILFFYLVCR